MSTTFNLQELRGAAGGRWRLDTAGGSDSPAAGIPVLQLQAGAVLGPVRDPNGHEVLYAKRLGFGDAQVGDAVLVRAVSVSAAPQPGVVPVPSESDAGKAVVVGDDGSYQLVEPGGGTSVAPEVGDQCAVSASTVAGGYLTDWTDMEAAPARSFTIGTDGVTVVNAGIYAVVSHARNDGEAAASPYIAVLRADEEVGPYWDLGLLIEAAAAGEVSATVVAEAGDVITMSYNGTLSAVRAMVTRIA